MNSQRSATSLLPYSAASVTLVGPCSSPYKSTVVSVVLSEGVTSVSVISAVVAEVSDPLVSGSGSGLLLQAALARTRIAVSNAAITFFILSLPRSLQILCAERVDLRIIRIKADADGEIFKIIDT